MTTAGAALEQGLKPPTVRVSCQRNLRGLRMAEPCFQPGKIVLPGNENLCLKRSELIGRLRGPDEGPMTAINMLAAISGTKSLAVLDGVRPEFLGGLGGREADRRPGQRRLRRRWSCASARCAASIRWPRARRRSARLRRRRGGRAISRPSAKGRFVQIDGSRSSGGGRWRPRDRCRQLWPACSRRASWRRCGSSPTRRATASNAD